MSYSRIAVFDVGKTNIKFSLLDEQGHVVYSKTAPNHVLAGPLYPHYDVEYSWGFLLEQLALVADRQPQALITTTHGATGALMDGENLALPILDYEYPKPFDIPYPHPDFAQTASPAVPNGLNLGRQFYWQAQTFPLEFAKADAILMYPQYWAFRLCGVKSTEVTSLGAHSDLWNPYASDYSILVEGQGWRKLFPPMQPAWTVLGQLRLELAQQVGYTQPCDILSGVHDSNASLVPYLSAPNPTVVSTGTWVITMVMGSTAPLLEPLDMLANVNVLGQPVATARYMGGREFGAIVGSEIPTDTTWADLQAVINEPVFALPAFSDNGGAFVGHEGSFVPSRPESARRRYALASLYSALTIDMQLEWLDSKGDIHLEGSFCKNPFIPALLAALRPQPVYISTEAAGTALGAFQLAHWGEPQPEMPQTRVEAAKVGGLEGYKAAWRAQIAKLIPR